MTLHRFCFTEVPGESEFIVPKGRNYDDVFHHVPQFRMNHFLATTFYVIRDFMFKKNVFNWTLIGLPEHKFNLLGCLYHMSSNKSDMQILMSDIFEEGFKESYNLDIVREYDENQYTILSSYTVNNETKTDDVLVSSLSSFSLDLWFCVFTTSLLLMIIMHLFNILTLARDQLRKSRSDKYEETIPVSRGFRSFQWRFFDHFAWKKFIEPTGISRRFICLLTLIFSFFIINYWINLLHTDLVVTSKPETINSFQDIFKKRLRINVIGDFIPGTYGGKRFWEAMKGRVMYSQNSGKSAVQDTLRILSHVISSDPEEKGVWIFSSCAGKILLTLTCQQIQNKGYDGRHVIYPWITSDKELAHKLRLVIPKRRGFSPHPIITKRLQRMMDMGFPKKLEDMARDHGSSILGDRKGDASDDMLRCLRYSHSLPDSDTEFIPLKMQHFRYAATFLVILYIISLVILLIEIMSKGRQTQMISPIESDEQT